MLHSRDDLVHPDSIPGILIAVACGLAVVAALSLVDGRVRLIQGAYLVVAVALGWWIRGRYEARRTGAHQISARAEGFRLTASAKQRRHSAR